MITLQQYLPEFRLDTKQAEELVELFNSPAWGLIMDNIVEPILDMSITQIDPNSPVSLEYQAGVLNGWHDVATRLAASNQHMRNLLEDADAGN